MKAISGADIDLYPDFQCGLLCVEDGGKRIMSAFIALLALLVVTDGTDDDLTSEPVVKFLKSVMRIPASFGSASASDADELCSMINRIVRQNVASKVSAVSSWQWACVLRTIAGDAEVDYQSAVDAYNAHPNVVGYQDESGGGSGSLELDGKKIRAIKHWLECTSEKSKVVVQNHEHEIAWQYGAFSEQTAHENMIFIGSSANLSPLPDSTLSPLQDEPYITPEYKLQLCAPPGKGPDAQEWIFTRIVNQFMTDTAIVPVAQKKKYRLSHDMLVTVRNIMVFVAQCYDHLLMHLPAKEVDALISELTSGFRADNDWLEILESRPAKFSVSMLKSKRQAAQSALQAQSQAALATVHKEQGEVRSAKWKLYKSQLARDQLRLTSISKVPRTVSIALHKKAIEWKKEQAKLGSVAVKNYKEEFLATAAVDSVKFVRSVIDDHIDMIVPGISLIINGNSKAHKVNSKAVWLQ